MTKEQLYVLEKRMNEAPQYIKYFMLDVLLKEIETLQTENKELKEKLK